MPIYFLSRKLYYIKVQLNINFTKYEQHIIRHKDTNLSLDINVLIEIYFMPFHNTFFKLQRSERDCSLLVCFHL